MPRLVTVKQFEDIAERAKNYVKAYILFPSGILGLISMVAGTGALGYRYILHHYPEVFAGRMRPVAAKRSGRARKESPVSTPQAPGAKWIPLAYVAGMGILFAASSASMQLGQVHPVAAYLMPWGGFFWAKLYFWRAVIKEGRR
jgi:hypothetical protein